MDNYLVEMIIDQDSPLIDKRAYEFRQMLDVDTSLMGFINENNIKAEIHGNQKLIQGQILILKINTEYIAEIQERFGLTINADAKISEENNIGGIEAIIIPKSRLIGRRYNYFRRLIRGDLSLLGLWRKGLKFRFRLSNEIFQSGDVLLLANRNKSKIGERFELAD